MANRFRVARAGVIACALVAVAGIAGCARHLTTIAPSAGRPIVGTWVECEPNGALRMRVSFAPNGTYAIDVLEPGTRDVTGRYVIDGGTLTLFESADSPACPGATSEYAATLIDGELQLVRLRETCMQPLLSLSRPWRRAEVATR